MVLARMVLAAADTHLDVLESREGGLLPWVWQPEGKLCIAQSGQVRLNRLWGEAFVSHEGCETA